MQPFVSRAVLSKYGSKYIYSHSLVPIIEFEKVDRNFLPKQLWKLREHRGYDRFGG